MKLRLAFWMTSPPGRPGDVVEVPDHRVEALVRSGIGRPVEESELASIQEPAQPAVPDEAAVAPE